MNIVITGTSQGIGLELTRVALHEGHRVLAVARPSSHLQELRQLEQEYPILEIVLVDLEDTDALSKILGSLTRWPSVDLLINNAGIYLKEDTEEELLRSFRLNSVMPLLLTKSLLSLLRKSENPRVFHVSSQMGSIADVQSGGHYAYRTSKAALNMMNKILSKDEPWLTTIVLHPGWVKTRMGGEEAPMTVKDSVKALWPLMNKLVRNESGKFYNYKGEELPW